MRCSARQLLGLPVIRDTASKDGEAVLGLVESVTVNPTTLVVDGFLLGRAGRIQKQTFLPRECVVQTSLHDIRAYPRLLKKSNDNRRILGLTAWTTSPRAMVGFVHDCTFSLDNGAIESFVIHQLIRTWTIPATAVEKITPRALLIHTDTTIKLKITPYPSEAI
jgi:uncharacterized protein YrrD